MMCYSSTPLGRASFLFPATSRLNTSRYDGREGRPFTGIVCWVQRHQKRMTAGDFLGAFEDMATEEEPFAYGIRHIKPSETE